MKSKTGVSFASGLARPRAWAGYLFACLLICCALPFCPAARASSVSPDYTASYSQNFYAADQENLSNTTASWATDYGYLSLRPTSGSLGAASFQVEDKSYLLKNFRGPLSLFTNDNDIPILGSKAASLNFPLDDAGGSQVADLSSRLTDFGAYDLRALGFSACGDVEGYVARAKAAANAGSAVEQLGDDVTHAYILAAGDNADRETSSPQVKLEKLKLISYAADGTLTTRTEEVSAPLAALGFTAISDVSCSDKECLIAGRGGKLARYDGQSFTDLSSQLASLASCDNLQTSWNGTYFLLAGSQMAATGYAGHLYGYQDGALSEVATSGAFLSPDAGSFALAFDAKAGQWLVLHGGREAQAYLFSGGSLTDVSSSFRPFYAGGNFVPVLYRGENAWYVANVGSTGALVRFDGISAEDIRSELGVTSPINVIGANGDGSLLLGGGSYSVPKLYRVSETVSAAGNVFNPSGRAESLKVNSTTGTIASAYIRVNQEVEEGTSLRYFLSADGGGHWQELTPEEGDVSPRIYFSFPGNDLRWKVEMATEDNQLSPLVYGLAVYYSESVPGEVTALGNWDLARAKDGTKVYVILNGKRLWIASAQEFARLGYSWSQVKIVPSDLLASYAEVKLVKAVGSDAIYYLTESGRKKLVLDDAVFKSYGNRYEDVVELDPSLLSLYPQVQFIKGEDGRVYRISGGTKRWIKSPQEFASSGGQWSEVSPVNATELAAYADSDAPTIGDGDLLRAYGSPDVYIVKLAGDKKFKRLILTPQVFESYGHLKWENVKQVEPSLLATFTESDLVSLAGSPDVYLLAPSEDSGSKRLLSSASLTSGSYDPEAVYAVNAADFASYQDEVDLASSLPLPPVAEVKAMLAGWDFLQSRYHLFPRIDRARFKKLLEQLVLKEEGQAATGERDDFQKLAADAGLSAFEKAELVHLLWQGLAWEKLFLTDAAASLRTGQPVRSAQRLAAEKEIIAAYPFLSSDFISLDQAVDQARAGGQLSLTREQIDQYIAGLDATLPARVNQLL